VLLREVILLSVAELTALNKMNEKVEESQDEMMRDDGSLSYFPTVLLGHLGILNNLLCRRLVGAATARNHIIILIVGAQDH